MRTMLNGFNGWARMQKAERRVDMVDSAITVVFTLLVAVTFTILHH